MKLKNRMRLLPMAAAMLLTLGLAGCADDASGLGGTTSGTTGGTTGGTTSGTTGGTTSGTTAGTTGGTTSGTTAGTTGGTTSGTTAGTTGGTTSGTTAGTTGGTTSGTTAGTTGGTTAGTTGGTTSGTTGGTTSGTTGGTTTGGAVGGIVCNPTSSTYRPIQIPNATAVGVTNGICLGCSVGNPENAIDTDITTISTLNTPVGLLGASAELQVQDTATLYPAGRRAGFVIFDPAGALLTATLLQTIRVDAVNNGVIQSSANSTTLSLDLLGSTIIGSTEPTFASFVPTTPFNELRISFGSAVNALAQLGVFQACVAVDPNDPGGTTSGTTGGTTTGGTTAGTTGGTTSGTTGGTTSGTTGGTTSGTTGGTTSGTTGGTTTGGTTGGTPITSFCDPLIPASSPLLSPNATATSEPDGGLLCLGCDVLNPNGAIDSDLTSLATISAPISLLGSASVLSVVDTSTTYPVGRRVGFVVVDPAGALLTATLLQNITVRATLNGTVVSSADLGSLLNLDLLGTALIGGTAPSYASFLPTSPFNGVELAFRNVVGALGQLKVAQVCVSNN